MNMKSAHEFLARCFAPGETIALLLRSESPANVAQRIVKMEVAATPRYLGWLAHENHHGANVYVAANPLRSLSRKRTKESIASVRHLYIDIDRDGDARLSALRASEIVPTPTVVLSTSAGKYQVLWQVEEFDFCEQETTLKLLAMAFHGDIACTDCNRVLRLPGFLNCKYDPAPLVTAEYLSETTYGPKDFHLSVLPEAGMLSRVPAQRIRPEVRTHSENDWAWVLQELTAGKDAINLTSDLASRRSDKPNPTYYAQRTVDMASARLWLLEGTPIADVVARLDARRNTEIPAASCFARAREIAATAERMIARKMSA
jgi:RepB DNA-primase from phage plasmid